MKVTWNHFTLSFWKLQEGEDIEYWETSDHEGKKIPKYVVDLTTRDIYWNEPLGLIRFKCTLVFFATPLFHSMIGVGYFLSALSMDVYEMHTGRSLQVGGALRTKKELAFDMVKNFVRFLSLPFFIIALELVALMGVVFPLNGRKLYASVERAYYGEGVVAPCFQPKPQNHGLGGDPKKRGAI